MDTNDDRFAQAKTFNDLDMRMNEFPVDTVTDWAGNAVSLYANDCELQRKVCIAQNAKLKDVVFYYMNGDITYEEGLKWCEANGVTAEQFDRWVYMEQCNRGCRTKKNNVPWFYRPAIFIIKVIRTVIELILFLEDYI